MQSLHMRKRYEFEAIAAQIPALKAKLHTETKKWLETKAAYIKVQQDLLETSETLSEMDRQAKLSERCNLYNKLRADKEALEKEEARINAMEKSEAETNYMLRAVPFLNCSYKYRSEVESIDVEISKLEKDEKKASDELLRKRQELTKAIRDLADEYVKQFCPELAKKLRKRELNKLRKGGQSDVDSGASALPFGYNYAVSPTSPNAVENGEEGEIKTVEMEAADSDRDEEESFLGNDLANASYDQIRQLCPQRQFTYRRINHFREYLRQIQGKSRANIPQSIYDDLAKEFSKAKIALTDVQPRLVRLKLKKLGQSKYYEHIEAITHRLNGTYKPINIDPGREEKLCFQFTQLEAPFEKIKKQVKKTRKNFLSYPYAFYKLCELNSWDEYLHAAYLLKSVSLLVEQDKWWSLVCQELNWQFIGRTVDAITRR